MTEQNLRKRFNLRIGRVTNSNVCHIEPIEIDHLWPTKHCLKCNEIGHYANDCHYRSYVYAVNSNGRHIETIEFDYAQFPTYCHVCNQLGHLTSRCFNRSHINAVASINPDGVLEEKNHIQETVTFLMTGVIDK